jgi:CHAD domain-containing protein
MPRTPTLHLAPTGADAGVLAAGIAELAGGRVERVRAERRTVLDTFDWRLHRGGFALERVESGDGDQLVLRCWGRATPVVTVPWEGGPPTFAPDLPAGRLRDAVAPLLDVRALLEVTDYDATQHLVVVRNDDDKAVARAAVDDLGAGTVLVRHLPVRGYERAGDRLADAVAASRCEATSIDPLDVALERGGRAAGDQGGRLAVDLDREGPAAAGWLAVLRSLLDEIVANVPGTLAAVDTEFLHDLRVAVRRSRSALRHAHGVLPDELLACFRPALQQLQELTGPSRDLDVYVLAADDDFATVDEADRPALEPFRRFLAERRADAHEELDAALRSDSCRATLDDWGDTLDSLARAVDDEEAGEWGPWPAEAHRDLADITAERIRKQHRKLVKGGRAIDEDSPATALHDLRKRGKELRYLLELFGSPQGAKHTATFVKALKGLQDVLGEFQDTEVQVTALRGWADELATAGGAAAPTMLAMGELIERLQQRQAVARSAFADRFARFLDAGRP